MSDQVMIACDPTSVVCPICHGGQRRSACGTCGRTGRVCLELGTYLALCPARSNVLWLWHQAFVYQRTWTLVERSPTAAEMPLHTGWPFFGITLGPVVQAAPKGPTCTA